MKKVVKDKIKEILCKYTEVDNLETIDVIHIYDTGKACMLDNSGYHDSNHFMVIGYNTEVSLKVDLGRHDGIRMDGVSVYGVTVFIDGSTLLRFKTPVKFLNSQCIILEPAN